MDELIQQETADRRYPTGLLALFAAFGFLLGGDGADHVCDHGRLYSGTARNEGRSGCGLAARVR